MIIKLNESQEITISYYDDYGNEISEYTADLSYYLEQLKPEDKIELVKKIWNNSDKERREWFLDSLEWEMPGAELDLSDINQVELFLDDAWTDEIYEAGKEDIEDFYREDAEEAYEDRIAYEKDPYGYYGLKLSDFY